MEDVGGVILERRLPVPVADGATERERLLGQRERLLELALGAEREREVVERGCARARIALLGCQLEAALQLRPRRGQDSEDVVRLGPRPAVAGRIGELERVLRERLRLVVQPAPVRVEAPVGDDARRPRRTTSSACWPPVGATTRKPGRSWSGV